MDNMDIKLEEFLKEFNYKKSYIRTLDYFRIHYDPIEIQKRIIRASIRGYESIYDYI